MAWLPALIVGLADIILLFQGYRIESLEILSHEMLNQETAENAISILYTVSNSNLMIVVGICIINVLAVAQTFFNLSYRTQLFDVDKNGEVREQLTKVERHLTDYDKHTIAFELLSEVEISIGAKNQKIHNEIWILTNNLEETGTSEKAKQLRRAIISNLRTNVDYYYVIPKSKKNKIDELGRSLLQEAGNKKITGKFMYIVDEALDFIPTPYFDIDMYLVKGIGDNFIQDRSVIYYCFSRTSDTGEYFYRMVQKENNEKEIWERMTEYTKQYKSEHIESTNRAVAQFTVLIPPSVGKDNRQENKE